MSTIGKSDYAQQKENERLLSLVNSLQKKVGELEKSYSLLSKNVVDLQSAVKLIQQKIK